MQGTDMKDAVFIDPLSDFGFKRIFGRQSNTAALIDLINALLKLDNPIIGIILIATEQTGELKNDRKAFFDLHCVDKEDNYFIIEVQRIKESFFKDRSVYYSTFPIRSQAERGEWNFKLQKTYTICILDFCFDDTDPDHIVHKVKLLDLETREVFYDQLAFLYVELPKFNKRENELISREDKWLYVLRNIAGLKEMPISLSTDPVFKQFFMDARKAHLTELELWAYNLNKKAEWDAYAIKETAMMEGKAEGLAEGKAEATEERNTTFVKSLLQHTAHSIEEISRLVGVSPEFVIKVKQDNL